MTADARNSHGRHRRIGAGGRHRAGPSLAHKTKEQITILTEDDGIGILPDNAVGIALACSVEAVPQRKYRLSAPLPFKDKFGSLGSGLYSRT
ncbi:hypothetical protein D3C87_1936810 [compost metagenome]